MRDASACTSYCPSSLPTSHQSKPGAPLAPFRTLAVGSGTMTPPKAREDTATRRRKRSDQRKLLGLFQGWNMWGGSHHYTSIIYDSFMLSFYHLHVCVYIYVKSGLWNVDSKDPKWVTRRCNCDLLWLKGPLAQRCRLRPGEHMATVENAESSQAQRNQQTFERCICECSFDFIVNSIGFMVSILKHIHGIQP